MSARRGDLRGLGARRSPALERSALAFAALLIAAALFEPAWPGRRGVAEYFVVLDITQSMNVADMRVAGAAASRLHAAKAMLAHAVAELECGSKIGLGVFSAHRALPLLAPVEVCGNRQELLATLALLDGRMAWAGNSEVAKGLNSALRAARELQGEPTAVFVTDGHEAPPLDPRHRPPFDDAVTRGQVRGLIVGVGGDLPMPIPRVDPEGRTIGYWRADEVMQTYPRGRGSSIAGEALVEDGSAADGPPLPAPGSGSEHLSALREGYLQLLARETGLHYHRLRDDGAWLAALHEPALLRERPASIDLRPWFGAAALAALLAGCGLGRVLRR